MLTLANVFVFHTITELDGLMNTSGSTRGNSCPEATFERPWNVRLRVDRANEQI